MLLPIYEWKLSGYVKIAGKSSAEEGTMKKKYSGYVFIVLCAFIFSTMEVMLKTVSGVFAPMQITCLRFLIGGILLLPFARQSLKRKHMKLHRKDIGFFAMTGFLCIPFSMVLYQMAVMHTKASVVALIFSCNPIFVTFLAYMILHEEIRINHILALCIEAAAILLIISPWNNDIDMYGVGLALFSALIFSLYSVAGKRKSAAFGGIVTTCCSFLAGGTELLFVLLLGRTSFFASLFRAAGMDIFAGVPLLRGIPVSALPSFFYICAVNSAVGYVCHMLAMEKTSAREASLVFFLKPIIAPVIAWLILHEEITLNMRIGIFCFLVGSGVSILPGILQERAQQRNQLWK